MRWLIIFVLGFAIAPLFAHNGAEADSVADLNRPSSLIPGCLNYWNVSDPRNSEQTCEGKAAVQSWQERSTTIITARNVLMDASRSPDRADQETAIGALNSLAAVTDAITSTYRPQSPLPDNFATTLAWMKLQFQSYQLPVPATLGDGFRTLSGILSKPALLISDRNTAYDRASIIANALSEAVTGTLPSIEADADAAVFKTHQATLNAAQAAENGSYNITAATAAIAAAAGPGHETIANGYTKMLTASLAQHATQAGYVDRTGRQLIKIPSGLIGLLAVCAFLVLVSFRRRMALNGFKNALEGSVLFMAAAAFSWLPMVFLLDVGILRGGIWPGLLWLALFGILFVGGNRFLPARLRIGWSRFFEGRTAAPGTHGTARFGEAKDAEAAGHLAPASPSDTFVLGWLRGTGHLADGRFRQGGHVLTCAPTGAGKGIGAVIPNLLEYPGSAFVLDFKGENYAVTARAKREAGQAVFLIDPFGITGAPSHGMNWLDALNPEDPDVVALAGAMAEMLVVSTGPEHDPHWTDTARELLRGLLIYIAGLSADRRTMSELRAILTASEDDWAEVLADMLADPLRGHRIVARTASAYLNRPEKERGSVLSTLVRHTAWLDDPRLAQAFNHHDFDLRDLKRRQMTVYLALPPDRLRACLGFVRGFIGLALDSMTATQGRPAMRVAFFLDEFGQLGRMDTLADNITMLRGYGAQFWLFVQDLSQLKAVYPRWQSFLANTTQQFFGTADYDTARYLSDALGQFTVRYRTSSLSMQTGFSTRPGGSSMGSGEHLQGRSLLTPDEIMRLGPTRPIVMISGETPYLLDRLNYLTDAPYADRFDLNPMHSTESVK
jgi:type IV secretory pathway TraG/TraD family ATPase VirD4